MGFRINIVSPGRFHVCDLARELDKNGWDVSFYSFVPTKRAMKFGLPAKCNKTVLPFVLPPKVFTAGCVFLAPTFRSSFFARKIKAPRARKL